MSKSDEDIRDTIRQLVLDMAPEKPAAMDGGLRVVEDLGFTSLTLLELIFALEEELDTDLTDEGAASFINTLGDIEQAVLKHIRNAAGAGSAP